MRFVNLLLVFFVTFAVSAQKLEIKDKFILQGRIKNNPYSTLDLAVTGFLDNVSINIPINKDGSFKQEIGTEGVQDLYLYVNNDGLIFFVVPGDTININWDEKDFSKTFTIASPNPLRNKDLQLCLKKYYKFRQPFLELRRITDDSEISELVKYVRIQEQYEAQVNLLLEDTSLITGNIYKMLTDVYFDYASILQWANLLKSHPLKKPWEDNELYKTNISQRYHIGTYNYQTLSQDQFKMSQNYRSFLYDWIRFDKLFKTVVATDNSDKKRFNPIENYYYRILGNIELYSIRDWAITKTIIDGFRYCEFQDCEDVMNDFLAICKNDSYKKALNKYYDSIKKLKPGNVAPSFSLKDSRGKTVSLSDFKGKVVYMDFWGVGCGPCIYEIKNFTSKLHDKYKEKNVVFLNICVDSNEPRWQKALKDFSMKGVNLIAEGWESHPVCQSYNIHSIPHYMIIDEEGKIFDNNASRPSIMEMEGDSTKLEKALKKSVKVQP